MPCGGMGNGLANLWAVAGKQVKEHDTVSEETSTEQTRCPDCGWHITGDFSWCPQCGARLQPYQCEYCEGTVPKNLSECPRCGAPLG